MPVAIPRSKDASRPLPARNPEEPARATSRSQAWRVWARGLLLLGWFWCVQHAAWILSATLHLVLAVCVAGVAWREREQTGVLGIEAVLSNSDGAASDGFDAINEPGGGGLQAIETGGPGEFASLNSSILLNESNELAAQRGMSDLLGGSGTGGGSGGSGGGTGGGFGDGHGTGIGPGFFGTQGEGRSFIYIVDMSGSMGGDRFQRAIAELVRSVNRLKPHQEFYVFFFNDRTYPMFDPKPANRMILASSANKTRAVRWIRSRRPTGLTNPMFALEQALAMTPDVIFLLTDGELDNSAEVREMLRKRNQQGTSIHTIAFESPEGAATLEAIAKENKGVYRFVK